MHTLRILANNLIIKKPKETTANGNGIGSGPIQRVVTDELGQMVRIVVDDAVNCGRAISATKFNISLTSAWGLLDPIWTREEGTLIGP